MAVKTVAKLLEVAEDVDVDKNDALCVTSHALVEPKTIGIRMRSYISASFCMVPSIVLHLSLDRLRVHRFPSTSQ